MLTKKKNRNA